MNRLLSTKQFLRDYRMPLQATFLFALIIGIMLITRAFEGLALADVLGTNGSKNSDYASLLSKDKADDFKKNDQGLPEDKQVATNNVNTSTSTSPTADTSSPFTVSPSPPPPTTPPVEGSPNPEPTPTFSASIDGLVLEFVGPVECSPGFNGPEDCSKRYVFRGVVKALNGPGSIDYVWNGTLPQMNGSGSFSVGSGETFTPVHKDFRISCDQPTMFGIQLSLTQPNPDQRDNQHQHSCSMTSPTSP